MTTDVGLVAERPIPDVPARREPRRRGFFLVGGGRVPGVDGRVGGRDAADDGRIADLSARRHGDPPPHRREPGQPWNVGSRSRPLPVGLVLAAVDRAPRGCRSGDPVHHRGDTAGAERVGGALGGGRTGSGPAGVGPESPTAARRSGRLRCSSSSSSSSPVRPSSRWSTSSTPRLALSALVLFQRSADGRDVGWPCWAALPAPRARDGGRLETAFLTVGLVAASLSVALWDRTGPADVGMGSVVHSPGASSGGTVTLWAINPRSFVPPERGLQPESLLPSRGVAASGFRPLCKIPHCCLP